MDTLVIPAYNEAKRLKKTIKEFLKLKGFELVFVVEGTDSTASIVKHYARKHKNIKLFTPDCVGKWGAVVYGFKKARGQVIGFVDADLPVTINNIKQGFQKAKDHDLVIGSRTTKGSETKRFLLRSIYSRLFNLFVKLFYQLPYGDTQCGFKVFNKNVLKKLFPLKSKFWGADVELLYKAKKQGLDVYELPVEWTEVGDSKLNFLTGLKTVFTLLRLRFDL